ncbi:MAG: hypothetical protein ACMXX6_00475 [Candidatus Woesearchaeota archaeon]
MQELKKYTNLNGQELKFFILIILTAGFILSFRAWGTQRFDLQLGLQNLILYTLTFAIFYLIFIISQKIIAYKLGYSSEFTLWPLGPMIGVLITFMTYGVIPFLYLGAIDIKTIPRLRLGKLRTSMNFKDLMYVGITGPLTLLLVTVLILEPIYFLTRLEILKTIIWICALIIFYTTLPLPNSNGVNILLYSKLIWIIIFTFSIITLSLILLFNIYSYIIALILALTATLIIRNFALED